MSRTQLEELAAGLKQEYDRRKAMALKLDLSRGKPGVDQLELSMPMMSILDSQTEMLAEDGCDTRNYGALEGIPEARRLMAQILDVNPEEVIVGGNSSLNLMHDCAAIGFLFGYPGAQMPWTKQGTVKFLCPTPGYDRHFSVSEHLGIEMINVPMTPEGPDMETVKALVENDSSIKGMWNVPKYSNPTGYTYSDETVRKIAALNPAAEDFRLFWDNAYSMHDLYPGREDKLLPLLEELKKTGKQNMALIFGSTSKITFAGAGISAVASSQENTAWLKKHMSFQTIGFDKVNQLRHARFFKDVDGVRAHMSKHAELLRPKFQLTLATLKEALESSGVATWTEPRGGYFISLDVMDGCAKRTLALCKEAGVVMTPAGATFPYGKDPGDRNIRIAPTFAELDELKAAVELLCICVRIACIEKLLA